MNNSVKFSKKKLNRIVKEEVKRFLLEEAEQKDEIRQMLDRAISQMEEHAELIRDTALVTSSNELDPRQLQKIMKFQADYVEELKKLKEMVR